jgi:hypothetical protein
VHSNTQRRTVDTEGNREGATLNRRLKGGLRTTGRISAAVVLAATILAVQAEPSHAVTRGRDCQVNVPGVSGYVSIFSGYDRTLAGIQYTKLAIVNHTNHTVGVEFARISSTDRIEFQTRNGQGAVLTAHGTGATSAIETYHLPGRLNFEKEAQFVRMGLRGASSFYTGMTYPIRSPRRIPSSYYPYFEVYFHVLGRYQLCSKAALP